MFRLISANTGRLSQIGKLIQKFDFFYKSEVECWKIEKVSQPNFELQEKMEKLEKFYSKINHFFSSLENVKRDFSEMIFVEEKLKNRNLEQSFGDSEISKMNDTIKIMKESNERIQN